jgi:hypothetical protein
LGQAGTMGWAWVGVGAGLPERCWLLFLILCPSINLALPSRLILGPPPPGRPLGHPKSSHQSLLFWYVTQSPVSAHSNLGLTLALSQGNTGLPPGRWWWKRLEIGQIPLQSSFCSLFTRGSPSPLVTSCWNPPGSHCVLWDWGESADRSPEPGF